jgi:small-conductance mechanosensitive channel
MTGPAQIIAGDLVNQWILPVGAGVAVLIVTLALRYLLHRYIHKLASKTKTCFDDIIIRDTRLATLLWCVWLGIYTGWRVADIPESWSLTAIEIVPALFVALGIYTGIVVFTGVLKWYREEICPKTMGTLDNALIAVMMIGIPVIGAGLGIILVVGMLGYNSDSINNWLADHLGRLAVLLIIGVVLLLSTILVIPKVIQNAVRNSRADQTEEEMKKRGDTLIGVLVTTLQVIIIAVLFFMVLSEVGINIASVLVGASVVGVAVGFGAQSLVKDVLAGLFIILENQYRKGDVVKIADTSGVVEDINLRRTILRDLDGITHSVPNGEIRVASNYTKVWSRANFNISVSYDTDLEKAMAVINRVGKEMAEDPKWAPFLISPPRALRVDNLGDSGIDIKVLGDTKPIKQWDVMGELRLRLKKAFDSEGIEIPWPHTKVYFGDKPIIIQTKTDGSKPV